MKPTVFAVVLALAIPVSVPAQSDMKGMDMKSHKGMNMDHKGMDMKGMKSDTPDRQVHKATGKVTKVDVANSSITIAHEPVPSMKWPAMNMAFQVKDKAILDKVKPNAKVDFSFTQSGRDYVITDIK